jgi:hypothetical protein|tara:strand:+ start:244 stop:501 length:258 start_codon:yes stop_codon:yes gene_type:complete
MDEDAIKELIACVIEQAVHDRRKAVTDGLLDKKCNPIRPLDRGEAERLANLKYFLLDGGLEIAAEVVGFGLPIEKIRRISNEPYD